MANAADGDMVESGTGSSFSSFLKGPLFALISLLVGVVGVVLAIYFYYSGVKRRDLTFYVNPTTTTIVKSGESSDLHVLFRGESVTTDVTGLQIAVWNRGKEAIHAQDVLAPIVIRASVPILEARIRHVSREVTHFGIDPRREAQGVLGLSWNILEHNDGAVVQVILAGDDARFRYGGTVEGQHGLSIIEPDSGRWYRGILWAGSIVIGVLLSAFAGLIKPFVDEGTMPRGKKALVAAVILITMICVGIAMRSLGPPSVPIPFD